MFIRVDLLVFFMDENYTQKLHEVYGAFSDSPEGIDGSHFARLCRDLNLELAAHNDRSTVPATMFDLIFARAKSRGQRRLDFNQFLISLDMIGQRMNLSIEEVIRAVCSISIQDQVSIRGGQTRKNMTGPAKFFYDVSTYTGTHAYRRSGKREENDMSKSQILDLREIVNRDKSDKWLSVIGAKSPISSSVSRNRLPHSGSKRSPVVDSTPVRGPAKFFYDKTTYTGIHKYTTPVRSSSEYTEDAENREPTNLLVAPKLVDKDDIAPTAANSIDNTPLMRGVFETPLFTECQAIKSEFMQPSDYLDLLPVDYFFSGFLRSPE